MREDLPRHPLFDRLSDELRAAFPRSTTFAADQYLIREDDEPRFFFLFSGSVEVSYTSSEGDQMTPKIFSAPAVFGEVECISQNPMHESVRTITECRIISIEPALFVDLTDRCPEFTKTLLWDVGRRFEICILNERLLGFGRANARLVNFLLASADAHGAPRGETIVIEREHSQESLAAAVGLNRRSVTRALDFLRRENLIDKEGRYFVLTDPSRLKQIAGDQAPMLHFRSSED